MGARPLLAALLTLILAAPAAAELPNQRPATHVYADLLIREAVQAADQRWHHRGLYPCAGEVYVYDEWKPGADARGEIGGCDVFFDRGYRDDVWQIYSDGRASRIERRPMIAGLCAVATHERGHNLGFDHDASGVMASPPAIPWQCERWAAWKLPVHGPPR